MNYVRTRATNTLHYQKPGRPGPSPGLRRNTLTPTTKSQGVRDPLPASGGIPSPHYPHHSNPLPAPHTVGGARVILDGFIYFDPLLCKERDLRFCKEQSKEQCMHQSHGQSLYLLLN